jgi:hypothetical protein
MWVLCRDKGHDGLVVLTIDPRVLDLPGVVITSQNASSDYVRFAQSPEGLRLIDRDRTFAESWKHEDDQIDEWRHKSEMCAEVLVPSRISAEHVTGACVSCEGASAALRDSGFTAPILVGARLFFLA